VVWKTKELGLGYSSPAIVGKRLYITGAPEKEELLFCLDVVSGKKIWSCAIGPRFDFEGNSWGPGPRSTPSVADGQVYALGGGGNLICADAASGKLVWSKHMMKDLGGEVNPIGGGTGSKPGEPKIGWGYTWSPLVDGSSLICFPGGNQGALAALDRKTGNVIWRSAKLTSQASYSSPIAADIEGVHQYIVLHNAGVTGIAAKDGTTLWNWENEYPDVAIPTPIYSDGHVFATGCKTGALLKITKTGSAFAAEMLYKGKAVRTMKNDVGGSVLVDGHAYGYSDKIGWVCQEMLSGKQAWAARGPLKAGSVVAADGMLYCYDEDVAEVALVEANPKEFVLKSKFALPETTKFKAPGGRNWTPPVISNGLLFIRDQELLFCFKINTAQF
jgi:outer membrane protein assembly factor BamB